MAGTVLDRAAESVRTLSRGRLCPGCERPFTPTRRNQRHCRPSCRKLAERKAEASRRRNLLDSFRDWAAEKTNVQRAACEAALAHAIQDRTEAAYHRTDLFDGRRELMNTWAKFATATPADVVSIRA